jgi:uncharacterized protein
MNKTFRHSSRLVLACGLGVIFLAALWLVLTGNTHIRYSADHENTVPVWTFWIPTLVGILFVRLIPLSLVRNEGISQFDAPPILVQTWLLVVAALLFPVLLASTGSTNLWFIIIKLGLLLVVPLVIFRVFHKGTTLVKTYDRIQHANLGRWYWLGPIFPIVVWFYLTYATPLAIPPERYLWPDLSTLLLTLVFGFLINAALEEFFYRVWLQTRLELLLGPWPATVLASLLWSIWHVIIQGGRGLDIDVATVFANQGVRGLFLGYLWSRYHNAWALLIVHGAINAASIVIALLQPN